MTNPMTDLGAREITMIYRNYRGEIAERTVTPLHIWWGTTDWHPEPGWLMTAFDHDKQADRDFALADCQFAALTPTSAEPVAVAYQVAMSDGRWGTIFHHPDKPLGYHRPLYAHPPAPVTVDIVLNAASEYMKKVYGIAALSHPVDRERIFRALSGEKS